jgi:hypothetical protein
MARFDSYDSFTTKLGEGEDEKGKFTKYRLNYEVPCSCHPETCCHFDQTVWRSREFKQYEDGSKVDL